MTRRGFTLIEPSRFAAQSPRRRGSSGFTLIELSIVLVIIGLIIGGVLVGRDLVRAAQLRSIITSKERYDTAVQTFRNKYNCLPGDCINASTFFSGATNGTGDGFIWNTYDNTGPTEPWTFWTHLGLSGLISGTYAGYTTAWATPGTDCPKSIGQTCPMPMYGGSMGQPGSVFAACGVSWTIWQFTDCVAPRLPANHVMFYGSFPYTFSGRGPAGALNGVDLLSIDGKIDDGKPQYGRVQTHRGFQLADDSGASTCITDQNTFANALYDVTHTNKDCPIIFTMSF